MKISKKYKPLFELLKGKHKEVDTVIMTGGRYSGKSFGSGLFTAEAAIQYDWKVLYTRFTNTSIEDSIVAEFRDKLEINNYNNYCEVIKSRVKSTCGDGEIVFKGIKTGSKNQTAALKSLSGFNCFVVDEAEEIPDYETFEKVYFSIRSTTKRNISILILNPTLKSHWVYQKYYEGKVSEGFNGIKDNVLYIHTSYLDVNRDFIPDNIYNSFEVMKVNDPDNYNNVVMGGWIENQKGAVFKNLQTYDTLREEDVEATLSHIDVATSGNDYLCQIIGKLVGNKLFIVDVVMTQDDTNITIPRCTEITQRYNPYYLWIESNSAGGIFASTLYNHCPKTQIIPYHQSGNKETRIINVEYFVSNYVLFRDDYEHGSDYDIFMRQIRSYNKDKKKNANDDAPDCLTGLCEMVRNTYPHLYLYNESY